MRNAAVRRLAPPDRQQPVLRRARCGARNRRRSTLDDGPAGAPMARARRRARCSALLGWPDARDRSRAARDGTRAGARGALDQLFTATEVNEWALCAALVEATPDALAHSRGWSARARAATCPRAAMPRRRRRCRSRRAAPVLDERGVSRFERLSAIEARRDCVARRGRRRCARLLVSTTTCSRSARAPAAARGRSPRCRTSTRCRGRNCTTCRPRS